ncbi:class I SAM-dependent methyltransferase [Stieleria varia]|uniref:methyltransferase domain-containing protein n=1 Tax=Stieleria varia TaxID=2528005 RepID=UPI0011B61538
MKIRDSGMPEEAFWETLFDVDEIVDAFGWTGTDEPRDRHAIEFGCGYGSFTAALKDVFRGRLDCFELEPEMICRTKARIPEGCSTVHFHALDFLAEPWPSESRGAEVAILFHMLHLDDPLSLLRRVSEHLAPGGTLAVLHWRSDRETPRGPAMNTRPTLADLEHWADELNARSLTTLNLTRSPHHFAASIELP